MASKTFRLNKTTKLRRMDRLTNGAEEVYYMCKILLETDKVYNSSYKHLNQLFLCLQITRLRSRDTKPSSRGRRLHCSDLLGGRNPFKQKTFRLQTFRQFAICMLQPASDKRVQCTLEFRSWTELLTASVCLWKDRLTYLRSFNHRFEATQLF